MWSWTCHTWAERNGKRDNDSRKRVILSSEVKHHGSASAVCSHECHPCSAHNLHCTKNGKCRTNSMIHFNFSSHNQNMLQSISLKLNTKQISVMHWVTQFTETRWREFDILVWKQFMQTSEILVVLPSSTVWHINYPLNHSSFAHLFPLKYLQHERYQWCSLSNFRCMKWNTS
jgi:hypothetical protein